MNSIARRFLIAIIVQTVPVFLIAAALLVHLDRGQADQQLREHAEIIAGFAQATREYVKGTLRPALAKHTDAFIIEAQSSTFIVNRIFDLFNRAFPEFTYRQYAENPLNPANRASGIAAEQIQRFRSDPGLKQSSGYDHLGGQDYFYLATPEIMEKSCLACHGSPVVAPLEQRRIYGSDHGYGWPVGEIVSATMIQVPVRSILEARRIRDLVLGGSILFFYVLLTAISFFLFRAMVVRRLDLFAETMRRMTRDPMAGIKLPETQPDEFSIMAQAFNDMADAVRETTRDLDRKVRERTLELEERIGEHERSRQEIERLARKNQLILQSINDGIYGVNSRNEVTFINDAGATMLGWEGKELIGKNPHTLMHHTRINGSVHASEECPVCQTNRDGQTRSRNHDLFWRKDGASVPVEFTVTSILENNEPRGAVVVFRDISDRLKTENLNRQLLLLQRVVNSIHKIAYEPLPLARQLELALEVILTIPWFFNQSKGAMFLVNREEQVLEMVAQKGLDELLLIRCARVPFGTCLCGRVGETDTFLFAGGIDDRHDIRFDGMKPHGHYIVPLLSNQGAIGILNLYLDAGHPFNENERDALFTIGNALSRLIEKRRAEENLRIKNAELEEKVRERTLELQNNVQSLQEYQFQLIQSERMAALGGMVAGVAHEINTPIGIGFTSATYLKNQTSLFRQRVDSNDLTYEHLHDYIDLATESSDLIEANLRRAAELINSFKMVAVDQTSQELRAIDLGSYLHEIILSLRPKLKHTRHVVDIVCLEQQTLATRPGAISQIVTNLVMNSLIHGFENLDRGNIRIEASLQGDEVLLIYRDNGRGMNADAVKRLYEPFYTTRRGQGGSGLGMHVVYNQVTQVLKGSITCQSAIGEGVLFVIKFPGTPRETGTVVLQGERKIDKDGEGTSAAWHDQGRNG
ncbi:MAG: DUF3365 domain-containing protein [Magnetococcales bacterium]|nr:DUF3365 domain-containing protein [Magnetococcales bacterium]